MIKHFSYLFNLSICLGIWLPIRNGVIGLYVCSADFSFSSDLEVDGCELDDEDRSFETGFGCADIGGLELDNLVIYLFSRP